MTALEKETLLNKTKKESFQYAISLFESLPFDSAKHRLQESLERCEDREFALSRHIEEIKPEHSCL